MLYNLRASLDYIVWQLALMNGRSRTPATLYFPCTLRSKDWKSAAGNQLKGVDSRWVDEIRRLQPFDTGTVRTQSCIRWHYSLTLTMYASIKCCQ